jgi:hypothetical protein
MEYFHWGPLVGIFNVDKVLVDEMLRRGDLTKEPAHDHLAGHFNTEFYFTKEDKRYFIEQTRKYWDEYLITAEQHFSVKMADHLHLESLWINYMGPNNFNPVHTHTADLSFVLYLDVPKELEEENRLYKNNDKSAGPGAISFLWGEGSSRDVIINNNRLPKTGEFYIFPTHLRHMVYPFKSDVTRVSMSGNLEYRNDSI